jgi:hypothetical protein
MIEHKSWAVRLAVQATRPPSKKGDTVNSNLQPGRNYSFVSRCLFACSKPRCF